ncbi:MAG: hypothetical protein Q9197_002227, partial [Variospora fuerteventurae]
GDGGGVDAEGGGVGVQVQEGAEAVLDGGGERVFRREAVGDGDDDGGEVVHGCGGPAGVVRVAA